MYILYVKELIFFIDHNSTTLNQFFLRTILSKLDQYKKGHIYSVHSTKVQNYIFKRYNK